MPMICVSPRWKTAGPWTIGSTSTLQAIGRMRAGVSIEQAQAELLVVEQEAPEIELEGLDSDPDAVEIVAVGDIAQMIVDEQLLDAERTE